MAQVHPHAQPFSWPGSNGVTCLLVHGFTGSPSEIRSLAEHLSARGYGIEAILLPGHGTTPQDMARTTWRDWYGAVEEEYIRLSRLHKLVIPIGFSMGGVLCLHLAARHPVPGIVTLSSPIFIANRKAYLAPLLKYFYKYRTKPVAAEVQAQNLAEGHFSYTITPISSLASLLQLIRIVKQELPALKMPALIMQSRMDRTVNPQSAQYIYDRLGSTDKELIWLQESGHVITRGPEKELVFAKVERFVARFGEGGMAVGV